MEERSQVMRGIPCNENVLWKEPIDHAFQALDALKEVQELFKDRIEQAGYWIDEELAGALKQTE